MPSDRDVAAKANGQGLGAYHRARLATLAGLGRGWPLKRKIERHLRELAGRREDRLFLWNHLEDAVLAVVHVEDELALRADRSLRELLIQSRLGRHLEEAAGPGVRTVECEQRARRAAGADQKASSRQRKTLCIGGREFVGQPIAQQVFFRQRYGREFAVGGAVDLDR